MKEKNMCTRSEVQEIVDRLERELQNEFHRMREERDVRVREIAILEINNAKDNMMKFVGWGGIVGVGLFIYFFGGMTNDIEYLQAQMTEVRNSMQEVNDFMNRGDRYTATDALELKAYVDQQDEYILRRVDDGFSSISNQIERLNDNKQ